MLDLKEKLVKFTAFKRHSSVLYVVEFKTDVLKCSVAIVHRPFVVRQRSGIARLGILPSLVIPDIPSLIVTALVVLRVLSPVIVLNLSLMISLMAPHISTP